MTRREDFKTLVADVSMGQVGAVFALEVSRLARSNLDGQRLLELCALALLQGLLLCGHCGRRLTVRYTGNGGIYPRYQCNWLRRESLASRDCLNLRCDLLDAAVAEEVLKARSEEH